MTAAIIPFSRAGHERAVKRQAGIEPAAKVPEVPPGEGLKDPLPWLDVRQGDKVRLRDDPPGAQPAFVQLVSTAPHPGGEHPTMVAIAGRGYGLGWIPASRISEIL